MGAGHEFRLAPEMIAHPLGIHLYLEEPFEDDLYYKIVFGCSESPTRKVESSTSPEEIQSAIKELFDNPEDPEVRTRIVERIMKIEEKGKDQAAEQYYQTL